jgi:hypothetical protein
MYISTHQQSLANSTCFKGQFDAPYDILHKLFGNPIKMTDGKGEAQWVITDDANGVFIIYDWKQPDPPEDNTEWNIGSNDVGDVQKLIDYILSKCV